MSAPRVWRLPILAGAVIAAYIVGVRPRHRRWGATPEEVARALPGDELVAEPVTSATHAITIRAPASEVWPWLSGRPEVLPVTGDEGDSASEVPSWAAPRERRDPGWGHAQRRGKPGRSGTGGWWVRSTIVGDGVLLLATAGSLVLAGGFAIFLAASGEFLPHDITYLGMSAADLCTIADCRIVGFMVHDRAAFGGALVAVGVLYAYLILFPLRQGQAWAWWLLAISGTAGFGSFLAYLGYGYLDTWHGLGTALLLPVFVLGLLRSRRLLGHLASPLVLLRPARDLGRVSARRGAGMACLLLGAAGTALGGLTILWVGITDIFVPEDLAFMGLSVEQLQAGNPRLVPLMAHDRAGFGGAVFTLGLTGFFCLWCTPMTRALWEAMLVSGGVGLAAAIGVHGFVGYTDLWHLAPALAAAASMIIGLALTSPSVLPVRVRPDQPIPTPGATYQQRPHPSYRQNFWPSA